MKFNSLTDLSNFIVDRTIEDVNCLTRFKENEYIRYRVTTGNVTFKVYTESNKYFLSVEKPNKNTLIYELDVDLYESFMDRSAFAYQKHLKKTQYRKETLFLTNVAQYLED